MIRNDNLPKVSVIIPHYFGKDILNECIASLYNSQYNNLQIIIVDNNSKDNSIDTVKNKYKTLEIVKSEYNRGFAGGCNLGVKHANGKYILILNNDTIGTKHWITDLVNKMESNNNISSVQPKIKNYNNKNYFDYSGACGGFIDKYCFPFMRGRIFNTIEEDTGQYDTSTSIFWASGTAFLTTKNIFNYIGGFDETFFAHMEEIDYHWKCQLLGYEVWVEPKSTLYHHGAYTLPKNSSKKTYFNYRNSLVMFLTNHTIKYILQNIFIRLLLEVISLIKELFTLRFNHALSIVQSWMWILLHPQFIISRRKNIIRKKILNNIFQRSIVFEYFIFKKHYFNQIT